MFGSVSISLFFVPKSESVSAEFCLEMLRTIDEKHSILDIVFLGQFSEKALGQCGYSR